MRQRGMARRTAMVATGIAMAASFGLAGGVMSLPAGAAVSAHIVVKGVSGPEHFSSVFPTSKITGEGPTAVYKPSSLIVSEDTSGGDCAESNPPTAFVIKNKGTATANVTVGGNPFVSLLAGQKVNVCIFGGSPGAMGTLGLSNKKNTKTYLGTLTITLS